MTWKQLKGATAQESALTDFTQSLRRLGTQTPTYTTTSTYPYWTLTVPPSNYAPLFDNDQNAWLTGDGSAFNPVVLTDIELPNGQKYRFSYTVYGEIERISYPTGGEEHLTIGQVNPVDPIQQSDFFTTIPIKQANRGVTERKVFENANANPSTWTYSTGYEGNNFKSTFNNPDGTKTERLIYSTPTCTGCTNGDFGFREILGGMAFEERSYASNSQIIGKKLTSWTKSTVTGGGNNWHPRVTKEENVTYDLSGNALSSSNTMEYDGDLSAIDNPVNVKKVSSYGFTPNVGSLGALQNTSETTYNYAGNYWAANIKSLPTSSISKDSAGNIVAQSQVVYDEGGYGAGGIGKPTTTRSWLNTNNSWVESHTKYNSYGNVIETTDARGNKSQIEYDPTYGIYPIKVRSSIPDPSGQNGSSVAFETNTTYDLVTGLPLTTTDANGQTTTMQYNDPLLRPTRVIPPSGGAVSEMVYNDTPGAMWVKTRTQIDATNWKEAFAYADGLGRTIKTQSIETQGDVFAETQYDTMGRAYRATNPYRNGEAKLWTQTNFDVAGRPFQVVTPDGAVVQTDYDLSTSGLLGTAVTVTDQAGKQRRSITNALGQLVRVDEPDDSGNLGSVASPTQPTSYGYDTLNNLVQVNQGVQQRNFSYNSLSRLLSATNPESGTINYGYDQNGNLTQKTDARGVVTNYVYDNINRVVNRNYSDGTPAVAYLYDNLPFAKGKLTQVASAISTTKYTSFDNLGRVLNSQQITDGQTYNFGYSYNLSGALVNETYPSGRIVTNQFQADGSLAQVNGSFQGTNKTYVGNFNYTSAGAVSNLQLGNGRWENTTFNARLQPTQIGLGSSANAQDLWKVNYDYGTTDNNGNVKSQQITVPNQFTANQVYSYDSLNRLKSAQETISGSQTWKQTYTFDRYGNRKFDATQTTTLGNCPVNVCNPDVNPANNKVVGHSFDSAGNTTVDAEGKQFFYDAENKQKEVRNASNQIIGQYLFDGDGKRVKKLSSQETVIFVFDAAGKLASEYQVSASQSQSPTTSYLTNDTLGSPRIVTDSIGNVTSRRDFMPYGEEIYRAGQGTDKVRQKFTGYERDIETNLDSAKARMFGSNLGRFTSPDDFSKDSILEQPQSWNKFAYVVNSPLHYVDPTGGVAEIVLNKEKRTITINASIAIYNAGKGKNGVSSDTLKATESKMKTGIEKVWNGTYKKDGVEYSVKLNLTVKSFDSKKEAEKSGLQNVIGMKEGYTEGALGASVKPNASQQGYDSGVFGIMKSDNENANTWAHEFGHLLGVDDHSMLDTKNPEYVGLNEDILMNGAPSNPQLERFRQAMINGTDVSLDRASQKDYRWAFSSAIDKANKSTTNVNKGMLRAGSLNQSTWR